MSTEEYIFCIEYHHNHKENKAPITKYTRRYTDLIYGPLAVEQEPLLFKRLYGQYNEEAFKTLKSNLNFVDAVNKMNEYGKKVRGEINT